MMKKLWNDEVGAVVSAELVLVITILGIGMITGLTSLRDGVITELADVGAAIGSVNQSYSIGGALAHSSSTAGSIYSDVVDFCDGTTAGGSSARCLTITAVTAITAGNDGAGGQ
jgi:Flp pilus assembly pilin Flp